jgi:hypothetical protein
MLHAAIARADDEPDPPTDVSPSGPVAPEPPPTTPPDARTPQQQLARPPFEPVPVPNPSPVVIAGVPTEPGHAVEPLEWKRARFSKFDFAVMVAGGATTLGAAIVKPGSKHLMGPILFDKPIEKALKAPTTQTQYVYRDASDVGLSLAATWPFFVDALITAWWYRGSRDVAEQMSLIGLETLAVSGAIQGVTNTLVSRERPYGPNCGKSLRADSIDCDGNTHYRSFFSGHSAFSFTAAGLICFEHMDLKLLGGPWDALSCAGAYGVAATTATFRVTGAEHYPTDVITGALVGSLVGWGIPALHMRHPTVGSVKTGSVTMRVVPSGAGAGVVGIF